MKGKSKLWRILLLSIIPAVVFFIVYQVLWLFIIILLGSGVLISIIYKFRWVLYISKRNWLSYPIVFILIVVTAIGIRLLFFEIFYIPSDSMRDTLYPGDRVLVEKLSFGPKMPANPLDIPWVNIGYYLAFKAGIINDVGQWPYLRLKGISNINNNDLLVYNLAVHPRQAFIKRCAALPGDTLEIRDAKVFINGNEIIQPAMVRHYCKVNYRDFNRLFIIIDSLKISINNRDNINSIAYMYLNKKQLELLASSASVETVEIETTRQDSEWITDKWDPDTPWTIDNFGPLIIPKKGMTIEMNPKNISIYRNIHDYDWQQETSFNSPSSLKYTFSQNFYFVLGDHRHDSKDSRYIGFVSEADIIGKAIMILFNSNKNHNYEKRLMKRII
jgi:signal peptidase I